MKIGNLNGIPWYARLGIFVAIALGVYAGFWYFVTRGTRKETKDLVAQINVLQKANPEAQIASQRLRPLSDQRPNYHALLTTTSFETRQMEKQTANKTAEAPLYLTAYYVSREKRQKQATGRSNSAPTTQPQPTQAANQAAAPAK